MLCVAAVSVNDTQCDAEIGSGSEDCSSRSPQICCSVVTQVHGLQNTGFK